MKFKESQEPSPIIDGMKTWNMAQFFYFSLNKLIELKDEKYMEGDVHGHYRSLRAILRRCSHKFTTKEFKDINDALNEVYEQFISLSNLPKHYNQTGGQLIKPRIEKTLDRVDNLITKYMDNHEMIEPKFGVKGVETVEKRMGLK